MKSPHCDLWALEWEMQNQSKIVQRYQISNPKVPDTQTELSTGRKFWAKNQENRMKLYTKMEQSHSTPEHCQLQHN